jgi:S1-C subfamily serine protease
MKKAPLYSRSRRPPAAAVPQAAPGQDSLPPGSAAARRDALGRIAARYERRLWALAVLGLLAVAFFWRGSAPGPAPLTFEQIDHLVRKSIADKPLASAAASAYEKVIPSVVRVVGYNSDADDPHDAKDSREAKVRVPDRSPEKSAERSADKTPGKAAPERKAGGDGSHEPRTEGDKEPGFHERGVGTGVVIIDNGTILTNLHVVLGADKVKVTFQDGLESDARLVSVMPEHDLAVLRAQKIPDDLIPATMRGTADLQPGDHVMAVGFPFGIGPSASEGIVSGLKREFRSPEGERVLTNLIQFDAAANPGNSGGPLVTMEGEVVGIVTAILNPTKQRVFVGIGFAVPIENAAAGAGLPPF